MMVLDFKLQKQTVLKYQVILTRCLTEHKYIFDGLFGDQTVCVFVSKNDKIFLFLPVVTDSRLTKIDFEKINGLKLRVDRKPNGDLIINNLPASYAKRLLLMKYFCKKNEIPV